MDMKKILVLLAIVFINIFVTNPCHAIKIGLLTEVDRAGVGTDIDGRMITSQIIDDGDVTYFIFDKERSLEMGFIACLTEDVVNN